MRSCGISDDAIHHAHIGYRLITIDRAQLSANRETTSVPSPFVFATMVMRREGFRAWGK